MCTIVDMAGCRGKLNKELIEAIAQAVEEDMPNVEACALFRISEKTFYQWKRDGEADLEAGIESLSVQFCQAIKEAESKAIKRGLSLIRKAGEQQWQADAWILERCYRKRFSQQGDALEKIEERVNDLFSAIEKMSGAKDNDKKEVDTKSDKTSGSAS